MAFLAKPDPNRVCEELRTLDAPRMTEVLISVNGTAADPDLFSYFLPSLVDAVSLDYGAASPFYGEAAIVFNRYPERSAAALLQKALHSEGEESMCALLQLDLLLYEMRSEMKPESLQEIKNGVESLSSANDCRVSLAAENILKNI